MADGYFITPQDAGQIEVSDGNYRRTMATTDEAMLCEFFLERNAAVAAHSHANDQVGYVVFGKVEMLIGDELHIGDPGDSFAIPAGIEHSVRAVIDSLLISVFSPPRNDYRTEAR